MVRSRIGKHRVQLKAGEGCIVVAEGKAPADGAHFVMVRSDARSHCERAIGARVISRSSMCTMRTQRATGATFCARSTPKANHRVSTSATCRARGTDEGTRVDRPGREPAPEEPGDRDERDVALRQMDRRPVEVLAHQRTARAAFLPVRPEHEVVDDQLASSVEELCERLTAAGRFKYILLLHFHPG